MVVVVGAGDADLARTMLEAGAGSTRSLVSFVFVFGVSCRAALSSSSSIWWISSTLRLVDATERAPELTGEAKFD